MLPSCLQGRVDEGDSGKEAQKPQGRYLKRKLLLKILRKEGDGGFYRFMN